MGVISRVPDSFIESTLSFISNLAGARHLVFFWLDSAMSPVNCRTSYISSEYQEFMGRITPAGPVSPKVLVTSGQAIKCLNSYDDGRSENCHRGYANFLSRYGFVDEVNLILRCQGDILAGIAAFRHIDEMAVGVPADFSKVAPVLEKSIPYIEFNLSRHLGISSEMLHMEIMRKYGLTVREAEIAELIGAGRTNSEIATCLSVSLATVKSHVINLFRKVGVENRSSLVALLPR